MYLSYRSGGRCVRVAACRNGLWSPRASIAGRCRSTHRGMETSGRIAPELASSDAILSEMGILADLVSIVRDAFKALQSHTGQQFIDPSQVYEKYVAPSYLLFRQIHNDYVEIYLELR